MYGTYDLPQPRPTQLSTKHGVLAGIGIGVLFCLTINAYQHHWAELPPLRLNAAAATLGCFPLPTLDVPACPSTIQAAIGQRLVDRSPFPHTHVDICYTESSIELAFHADEQTSFMTNPKYGYNDNIWQYNVMETFISLGTQDPATYFEFEVSPTNQSYGAFVFNPHKDFTSPIGHFFVGSNVDEARSFGIAVSTTATEATQSWSANASLPLTLFNVDVPQGTTWRMNFFRKITTPSTFPAQDCGAWNAPNQYNFHETPCFGLVRFVFSMYGALSVDPPPSKDRSSSRWMSLVLLAISLLSLAGVVHLASQVQSIQEQLRDPSRPERVLPSPLDMPQSLSSAHDGNGTKVLIVHAGDAWLGQFGQEVARGAKSITSNVHVVHPATATIDDVLWADAVVLGSNVYNANPDPELLAWMTTWSFKHDLSSKVASAFVLAGGISAGEELVMTSLLHAAMIFRFIIVGGDTWTSAFGASAIMGEGPFHLQTNATSSVLHGWPKECYRQSNNIPQYFFDKAFGLGRRVAQVASKLNA